MNRPNIRVLVVDDDEDDFFIAKELFNELPVNNITVEWASTYEKGIQSYKNGNHDIYFVDYLLGARTGIDFLSAIKPLAIKNPVIMLTGKGDQKIDKQAMELGALDYLVKSELDAENLERSTRYALDRFKAGKQLAQSEAKYRDIFEKSRDMIFIVDLDGTVIDCNDSFERTLGYAREEIVAKKIYDLFADEVKKMDFLNFINEKSELIDFERILIAKNGQKKVCLISAVVQSDLENNLLIQGVIHDITKRRKAENDLVTTEKLAVTDRVVRMIGHEIRNPLTNINLALEQIESEMGEAEDLSMYFDIIKRNSERINSLITELLNSSKPVQLNKTKISLNKISKDALELIKDRMLLKDVELITNFSENICDITVDVEKVKIALLNIFLNAVEAMEDSKGILKVSTWAEDGWCIVETIDNGSGISPDKLDLIFDPFFSGKLNGTGLGLSTTHNIIGSHNGLIDVHSEPGKGTCFIVKFNLNN